MWSNIVKPAAVKTEYRLHPTHGVRKPTFSQGTGPAVRATEKIDLYHQIAATTYVGEFLGVAIINPNGFFHNNAAQRRQA